MLFVVYDKHIIEVAFSFILLFNNGSVGSRAAGTTYSWRPYYLGTLFLFGLISMDKNST